MLIGRKTRQEAYDTLVTGCQETYISTNITQGVSLNKTTSGAENAQALSDIAAKNAARIRARTKRLNIALLGSHVAVVLGILGVVVLGYRAPVEASSTQLASSILEQPTTSVDQIAAANVASSVAQNLNLSVQDNVQNLAVSLNAKTDLSQTATTYLSKPQIVQENDRKGILSYKTKDGDNVKSVAAAYGISEDSVRWANNLTSDTVSNGTTLQLPGVTGIIYTVKTGDKVDDLASKYKADADRIVSYNDLEISGLQAGAKIVIPGGVLPDNERPGYRAVTRYNNSAATPTGTRVGSFGGNGYAFGYCTWYAYNRRAELGKPISGSWGNAVTWAAYARSDGFRVDRTPEAGAVIQNGGGYGHVGIVEKVNDDGSLLVSDMNYVGWNKISTRTIAPGQVATYNYIH